MNKFIKTAPELQMHGIFHTHWTLPADRLPRRIMLLPVNVERDPFIETGFR